MRTFKNTLSWALIRAAIIGLTACSVKDNPVKGEDGIVPIVFNAEDGDLMSTEVDTKAIAITPDNYKTALTKFYVSCTTGTAGSETSKWVSTEFKSNSAATPVYSGGKWWPISDQKYHFFASNMALTFAASGTTITADNGTDCIVCYMESPTFKQQNTLSFEHVFARLGGVTVSAASGYTISNVSVTITPKTGGIYNLRTGEWSSQTSGTATGIANATPGTKTNDLYLCPGTYVLTAGWTATNGDYTRTYSGVTTNVTLERGKINTISTTLGGNATGITFGVEVQSWGNVNKAVTFPNS